jgi:hypothetical protein
MNKIEIPAGSNASPPAFGTGMSLYHACTNLKDGLQDGFVCSHNLTCIGIPVSSHVQHRTRSKHGSCTDKGQNKAPYSFLRTVSHV